MLQIKIKEAEIGIQTQQQIINEYETILPLTISRNKQQSQKKQVQNDRLSKDESQQLQKEQILKSDRNTKKNEQINESNLPTTLINKKRQQIERKLEIRKDLKNRKETIKELQEQQFCLIEELQTMSDMLSMVLERKQKKIEEGEHLTLQRKKCVRTKHQLEKDYNDFLFMLTQDYPKHLSAEIQNAKNQLQKEKKLLKQVKKQLQKPIKCDESKSRVHAEAPSSTPTVELRKCIHRQRSRIESKVTLLNSNELQIQSKIRAVQMFEQSIQHLDSLYFQNPHDSSLLSSHHKLVNDLNRLKKIAHSEHTRREREFKQKLNHKNYFLFRLDVLDQAIIQQEKQNRQQNKQFQTLFYNQSNYLNYQSHSKRQKASPILSFVQKRKLIEKKTIQINENNQQQDSKKMKKIYKELEKNKYFSRCLTTQKDISQNNKSSFGKQDKIFKQKMLTLPSIIQKKIRKKKFLSEKEEYQLEMTKAQYPFNINVLTQKNNKKNSNNFMSEDKNAHKKTENLTKEKQICQIKAYKEICQRLKKDKLLIQEDSQYIMKDLIYH